MKLVEFTLYCDDRRYVSRQVYVNPEHVSSISEGERRPPDAFFQKVAYITLKNGREHCVQDNDRTAARKILSAAEAASDPD